MVRMFNPNSLPKEVVEALRRGNKIEAIKLLRAAAKVGLAEAKGVIDALEAHANRGAPPAPPAAKAHSPSPSDARSHAPPQPQHLYRPHPDGLSPGEVPRTSLAPVAILVTIATVVLAAWALGKFG